MMAIYLIGTTEREREVSGNNMASMCMCYITPPMKELLLFSLSN